MNEDLRTALSDQPGATAPEYPQNENLALLSMENMPVTVTLTDPDGTIQYVNPCCTRTFGYPPSEMKGAALPSFWIQPSIEWTAITEELKRSGAWRGKSKHRTKDGKGHWEMVSISAVRDHRGAITHLVKTGQPIEQPQTATDEQPDLENTYRQLLENSRDGYFEVDLMGTFTYVNQAICQFGGYSLEELLGLNYRDYMKPDEAQRTYDLYNQVYRTGKPSHLIEYEVTRKDGSTAVNQTAVAPRFNKSGKMIGFSGVVRDLTDLRKAEKALKASEQKHRNILSNLEEGYYETDLDGNLIAVNKATCRNLGRSENELMGMNYTDLATPETTRSITEVLNEVLKTGKPKIATKCELIRKDGTVHLHEMSVSLMRDGRGEPIGFFGISQDRTDAMALELALRESEKGYRQIMELAPDAIAINDVSSAKYVLVNEAFCRHLGYTPEEVIGRTPAELNIYQNFDDDRQVRKLLAEKGKFNGLEIGYQSRSGKKIDHLVSARVLRFKGKTCALFVATLIIPLKEAQAALREREESYRQILKLAPDAISINDARTSRYVQVNDAFCEYTGYTREEIIGRTAIELNIFQNPDDDRRIQALLADEGKIEGLETEFLSKSGEVMTDLVSARMISFEGKACALFVATVITPLKEAQTALKESEESYRRVMALAPDSITISRLSDGRYFEVNEAFCQQTGYSREEAINRSVLDLNIYADPEDRTRIVEKLRKHGRVDKMEVHFRSKDGKKLIDLFSARIIQFKGEDCVLVVATVINPLIEAQQALRESEKRLREILDSLPDAVCLTTLTDGTYIEANRAFHQRTGYTPEETLGRTSQDLNIYADPTDRLRFIDALKENGKAEGIEIPVRYKDGSLSVQLWSARIIEQSGQKCLLVAAKPIDDLKAAQQAMVESEESYRRIMELAPSMICITRVSDSRIVAVNQTFCEHTGYPREEAIGHTPIELGLYTDPENRKRWVAMLKRDGKVQDLELNFINREGAVHDDLFSAQYMRFKGEECILTVITSITSLKEVQRALQEKEESQRAILDTAPYAITIVSQSDLRYLQVNRSFCENTGYALEEVIGCTSHELNVFVDEKDRERMEEHLLGEGRIDGMEMRIRKKDGTVMQTLLSCRPMKFEGQRALLFISADITALKKTQRALRKSEAGYRSILDSTFISTSVISREDNRYVEVNKRFCQQTGYSRDEVVGRTVRELDIYADRSDFKRVVDLLSEHGRIEDLEIPYRVKNGKVMECLTAITPIRYKGKPCLLASVADLTAMKRAQSALRESEERFRAIFETAADAIFVNDLRDGRFLNINKTACRHLGYTAGELHSMSLDQIVCPGHPYPRPANVDGADRMERLFFESVLMRKDGTSMPVEVSSGIVAREGTPAQLSIVRDVSERKMAEQELERYRQNLELMVADRTRELEAVQQELVKREKLAVLGQLTATVSHELRNPLGVIRSSNFYLQRKSGKADKKQQKHFRRIDEQVALCDTIVADLLEFTRGRNINIVRQQLSDWMPEVIEQIEESEGIEISMETAENLPSLPHDRDKMRRVMINVLDNALQAVKARSKDNADFQPEISVRTAMEGGVVAIHITDNGIGMDSETTMRAFEPLFTTRARGTGIGLAIVKKIVEEHKGRITLHSRPGQGTEMKITLPCRI